MMFYNFLIYHIVWTSPTYTQAEFISIFQSEHVLKSQTCFSKIVKLFYNYLKNANFFLIFLKKLVTQHVDHVTRFLLNVLTGFVLQELTS